MKVGSKYYPLFEYLQHCNQTPITLTLTEIEHLLQSSLPASAYKRDWWGNRDSAPVIQAKAWIEAGLPCRSDRSQRADRHL